MEAIAGGPTSVHSPNCGEAGQLQGYTPAEFLRFSNSAACKMLAIPHDCFHNLFYKICKPAKLSNMGAQHWMLFDMCYITSRATTSVALRLMVLRLFLPVEGVTHCVQIRLDHAVQNLFYLTAHFFCFESLTLMRHFMFSAPL